MKPRITIITIGVDDLERSLTFYCDELGQEFEHGAVTFTRFGKWREARTLAKKEYFTRHRFLDPTPKRN